MKLQSFNRYFFSLVLFSLLGLFLLNFAYTSVIFFSNYNAGSLDVYLCLVSGIGTMLFLLCLYKLYSKTSSYIHYNLMAFLILQTLCSYYVLNYHYMHLAPNINKSFINDPSSLPGFNGIQHLSTNEKGFRVSGASPTNSKKVFIIGPSTVEGINLDDNKTWPAILANDLNNQSNGNYQVVNTGVSGTRIVNHYATLLEIEREQPDTVIFQMGMSDWIIQITKHFTYGFLPYADALSIVSGETKNIMFANTLLGKFLYYALGRISSTYKHTNSHKTSITSASTPSIKYHPEPNNKSVTRTDIRHYIPDAVSLNYQYYLNKIYNRCSLAKYHCIFLTQPTAYKETISKELYNRLWMTPPYVNYTLDLNSLIQISNLYNNHLVSHTKEKGFQVCDVRDLPADLTVFYDDSHYNESGAEKLAHAVSNCMVG